MKRNLLLVAAMLMCATLGAKIRLPEIMQGNMVLQQNTNACIWGWAEPGKTVSLSASWIEEPFTCKADKESGYWEFFVPTKAGSYDTYSLSVSEKGDSETVLIDNVVFGEVWFTSGQSNMEMPMNGFTGCPVEDSDYYIAEAVKYPNIRYVTVPKARTKAGISVKEETYGKWQLNCPANVQWFSATAYFFARRMSDALQVPIGIINCAWGGSRVEGWLPEDVVKGYGGWPMDEGFFHEQSEERETWEYRTPVVMYNDMFHPLRHYTIKGILWYQGEGNVGHEDTYPDRLAEMVRIWREEFNQGELPFYLAELAPWLYGDGEEGISGALFRECQLKASQTIPNSGMICTNDLAYDHEKTQIHPRQKRQVGERFANLVLNKTYGKTEYACNYPQYVSHEVTDDGKIKLQLTEEQYGYSPWMYIKGFEVAGEDGVFHPAVAEWIWGALYVWSDDVPAPVHVRYGFKNFLPGNLTGHRGLPVIPFRSDK